MSFILLLSACGANHHEDPSNDYVLIEFASKLEEEYDKLHPKKTNK